MATVSMASLSGDSVDGNLRWNFPERKSEDAFRAEIVVSDDDLHRSLVFLSDAAIGATTLSASAKEQLADAVKHTSAGVALKVLELVPFLDLMPGFVPQKMKTRILKNVRAAQAALHWSEKTAAVAAVKATELWHVESLIDTGLPFRDICPPGDASLEDAMGFAGVPAEVLVEISGIVRVLGAIPYCEDIVEGDTSLQPKLAGFLVATRKQQKLFRWKCDEPSLQTMRTVRHWAAVVVNDSESANAPGFAALVGICASHASCPDLLVSLWLYWVQMIRALAAEVSMSEAHAITLATACVAPFSHCGGETPVGKHAAVALSVFARLSNVYVDYAALRIGCNPGVDALKCPSAALDFLAATVVLSQPVCLSILEFLSSMLGP
jgi:hypothetical protein